MALTIRCQKHKRYNGKISPMASCRPCQNLYDIRVKAMRLDARLEIVERATKARDLR